ncbi:MAG: hypothetical protein RLY46_1083, partial [Bacteroidota bacterium]
KMHLLELLCMLLAKSKFKAVSNKLIN